MTQGVARGRFDPFLDWMAPLVLAVLAGIAGAMAGPLFGYSALSGGLAAAAALFLGGVAIMRAAGGRETGFALPSFEEAPAADEADDELLLDTLWLEVAAELDELVLDQPFRLSLSDIEELLLDDALPDVGDSRVVQLFEPEQLRRRIDRHLANARRQTYEAADIHAPAPADALTLALADLKRSLRRA